MRDFWVDQPALELGHLGLDPAFGGLLVAALLDGVLQPPWGGFHLLDELQITNHLAQPHHGIGRVDKGVLVVLGRLVACELAVLLDLLGARWNYFPLLTT